MPEKTGNQLLDEPTSPIVEANAATECIYKNRRYSPGSVSCQNGTEYRCQNDGTWTATGAMCQGDD
jgi:hypothetical protein